MSLPIPQPIIMINRMLEFYKKRHDDSEFVVEMQLCEQMILDLEELKNTLEDSRKEEGKPI